MSLQHKTVMPALTRDELNCVSNILASAFINDPVFNWVCSDTRVYKDLFRLEIAASFKKHQHIFINEAKTGAALWLPPTIHVKRGFHVLLLPTIYKMFKYGGALALKRGEMAENFMAKHHIKEPHFYLRALGAAQGHQGKGIGSSFLKHGLALCDKQQSVAYLESSTEANLALYERYGFKIFHAERIAQEGPMVWFMRREVQQSFD